MVAGNLQGSESEDNEPFQRAPSVRPAFLGCSLLVPRCALAKEYLARVPLHMYITRHFLPSQPCK